jgi:hypothetical protein
MAMVTGGLQAGEHVVINPDPFRKSFESPEPMEVAKK